MISRIIVCSPEQLFLDGLVAMLERRFYVVGARLDLREAIRAARRDRADVLVADFRSVAEGDIQYALGAEAVGSLHVVVIADGKRPVPEGFGIVLSRSDTEQSLMEKTGSIAGTVLGPGKRTRQRTRSVEGTPLTDREFEVATMIARGYSNTRIAEALGLREQSVKNLVSVVIRRLRCSNRVQVALKIAPDLADTLGRP